MPGPRSCCPAATTTRRSGSASPATCCARAGLHIRTSTDSIGVPVVVGDVAVYPLPYLEPAVAADPLGATERSHAGVLRAAMARVDADRAARGGRSVVMAHAFVTGGATSDSERDISVGGVVRRPPEGLRRGRLRRPRPPARAAAGPATASATAGRRWRCRSARPPTPRVPGWSTSAEAGVSVEAVDAPVERPLAVLRGDLDALLTDPAHTAAERVLVPGDPDRPRAPAGCDGAAAPTLPAHPGAAVRPAGRPGRRAQLRPAHHGRVRPRRVLLVPRPRPRRPRARPSTSRRCSPSAVEAVRVQRAGHDDEGQLPLACPRSGGASREAAPPAGHRLRSVRRRPSRSTSTRPRPAASSSSAAPPARARPACSTPSRSRCMPMSPAPAPRSSCTATTPSAARSRR